MADKAYTSLKGNTTEGRPSATDHPHHISPSGCEIVPGAARHDGAMALKEKAGKKGAKHAGY